MTTGYDRAHRLAVIEAAKALTRDAIAAARECTADSAAWRFYNGVQAASLHVLYPEMTKVREVTPWLDNEQPAFRDGFLEASALLGMAAAAPEPPLRLPLPRPADVPPRRHIPSQPTSGEPSATVGVPRG
jgi:hypothetical protein